MALKMNATTDSGVEVNQAYLKVEEVLLERKNMIRFVVRYYASASEPAFFQHRLFRSGYDIEGSNPIAQAYQHLKTLPEFSEAVDC